VASGGALIVARPPRRCARRRRAQYGGVMSVYGSSATVTDTEFHSNSAYVSAAGSRASRGGFRRGVDRRAFAAAVCSPAGARSSAA